MSKDILNNTLDNIKKLINDYSDIKDIRVCSECGHLMDDGYIDADFHYYCSDDCLHKQYSDDEWNELCENYPYDFYWTEWY